MSTKSLSTSSVSSLHSGAGAGACRSTDDGRAWSAGAVAP
uniref:Uncharacterized protein n=1 Tax=Arundo donax TaxID=35708 RepID=A0A0A9AJJ2_ARUDO